MTQAFVQKNAELHHRRDQNETSIQGLRALSRLHQERARHRLNSNKDKHHRVLDIRRDIFGELLAVYKMKLTREQIDELIIVVLIAAIAMYVYCNNLRFGGWWPL